MMMPLLGLGSHSAFLSVYRTSVEFLLKQYELGIGSMSRATFSSWSWPLSSLDGEASVVVTGESDASI